MTFTIEETSGNSNFGDGKVCSVTVDDASHHEIDSGKISR